MPTENRSATDQQYTIYGSKITNVTEPGLIKRDKEDYFVSYPLTPIESNISNANESGKIVLVDNTVASVVTSEYPEHRLNNVTGSVLQLSDNYVLCELYLDVDNTRKTQINLHRSLFPQDIHYGSPINLSYSVNQDGIRCPVISMRKVKLSERAATENMEIDSLIEDL
jgi:hypothetical protein